MASALPALAELHTHLGAAVHPSILWSIAHRRGIRLPSKDYHHFEAMITMTGKEKNRSLDDMHDNFFFWTELIQSAPDAMEESVKSVIGGGYRACNLVLQELRFNPMFRNRGGERDLDYIIMAAIWGLEKAELEYPQVKAGLILMMDRTLPVRLNHIILRKAIKYRNHGVVGIDLAGPQRRTFSPQRYTALLHEARRAGLGITIHTGEEGRLDELRYIVRTVKPDRIGHGILCVRDPQLMADIVQQDITLEVCPTSNLRNSVIQSPAALGKIIRTLVKHKVKFTINTDGPEMYRTNIVQEQALLQRVAKLARADLARCTRWAFQASFLK